MSNTLNKQDRCIASMTSGAWIAVELAAEKGAAFAETVIASDRWAFPKIGIEEARLFLTENGQHCRCASCRPRQPARAAAAKQMELPL